MLRIIDKINQNLVIFTLILIGGYIGYIWQRKRKRESHNYFYYIFSKRIDQMVYRVRETVNGRDEQRLIKVMYTGLEDFFLEYLKSDALRSKTPKREYYRMYELHFFRTLSSIKMEWTIRSVDRSLVYLFLQKNQSIMLSHLRKIEDLFLDKSYSRKERREEVAEEFIRFLENTSERYIAAYEEYQRALKGKTTLIEILKRLNIKKEESGILIDKIMERHVETCKGRRIMIENEDFLKVLKEN